MDLINPNTSISLILPELLVALAGVVVMVYDSFFPRQRGVTGTISLAGLAAAAIVLGSMWGSLAPTGAWNGMIAHDNLRLSFSFVFLFVTAITILVSTVWEDNENVPAGEYHALLMFGTFGMMLMASGNDLVVIFLGLETLSISTYVMAGLRRGDLKSNESAMKYFILGSFASAFLLYGMALTYGATGSTNITEISAKIAGANFPALLLVGGAMMIVGFGFKAATVRSMSGRRTFTKAPRPRLPVLWPPGRRRRVCIFHSCFCSRLSARCRCPGFGLSASIVDDCPHRNGGTFDDRRERRRHIAKQRQANAGLFVDRSRRLRDGRIYRRRCSQNRRRTRRSDRFRRVLHAHLRGDEPWCICDRRPACAEERQAGRIRRLQRHRFQLPGTFVHAVSVYAEPFWACH